MAMPDSIMYAITRTADDVIIGYCQGWSWMIPPAPSGATLVEVTTDGLPPVTPPVASDTLPPQKT